MGTTRWWSFHNEQPWDAWFKTERKKGIEISPARI